MKLVNKTYSQQHIYIFSILVVTATLMILYGIESVMKPFKGFYYSTEIIARLIPILFLVVIWRKIVPFIPLRIGKKGFVRGILLGWIMMVMTGLNINFTVFIKYGISFPPILKLISFLFYMLLVGCFEEFLIRGLILENMMINWGSTKKGIYKAAAVSSILFGMGHFANLINTPELVITTVTQVIYATFIGFFLSGVYLRSKNLSVVIIYHTVFNMAHYLSTVFIQEKVIKETIQTLDMTLMEAGVTLCLNSIFLLGGIWLLRKVEPLYKDVKVVL